jgi:hypothetical protein
MKEQLISFDTAKLAKEKGFFDKSIRGGIRISQPYFYNEKGVKYKFDDIFNEDNIGNLNNCYNAPTQSLLQKWLREKHGIHIQVYVMEKWLENGNEMDVWFEVNLKTTNRLNGLSNVKSNMLEFNSYEEALEEGLQEALKLI